uniref:RING-type domain-containing protein n=1 Tax=Oryza brachyantha TaxID=4533 RepID=J3NBH3_ORYBR
MGFDNECILNIQTLPGEYFCPVCRTLICPNEALQTQCTHLYCKPCLAYIVATTQACPYDGYLVTEADSKPLIESNKPLAETIGKVTVHCQYHNHPPASITRVAVNGMGLQPHAQAQHTDSSMMQSSSAATQAAMQGPSAVASAVPMIPVTAAPTTVLSTATARTGTASALPVGSAGATTGSTVPVAPSLQVAPTAATQGQAVAPQTPTAEQYQQQLQYQQYYQQQYPGYNPYMQQYQQYGQYQQYTQPQAQIAPQNVAQAPVQSASYAQSQVLQPNQPQHMVPFQPQNQPHLPQLQAPAVQPQSQQHPPLQSAPQTQIPQLQPQSQVPLQQPQPHTQPTNHTPVPTQVGSQPFAIPSTQATPSEVQPHHQVMAQQQQPQLQHLPQQQQSYPHMQAYHQPPPMPHAQPQNPSVHAVTGHQPYSQPQPANQMQQGAPLQRSLHVSHQQMPSAQHHALAHPSQGQQPAMMAQGTQHTQQHQHVGHHAQRQEIHASIPPQAAPQRFPPKTSAPSQTGQSYQQGMPSSQPLMHAPLQSQGQQFMQQHHAHTSAGRSMNYVAPPEQFQNQSGGPVKGLQASAMNQQPPTRMASDNVGATSESHGAGQPFGQGSLSLKIPTLEAEKLENATNATGSTEVSGKKGSAESALVNPIASGGSDGSEKKKGKGKVDFAAWESNSHDPDALGGRGTRSDISSDLVKGMSLQQAPQQNMAALGSYAPPGMGPQHPYGPDSKLPQHMRQPGHMPYMQGLPNQMRPPKHSFPENSQPPMQQPYEMAPRMLGLNSNQMQISQPIRPDGGMIRPPVGAALPGQHDSTVPPFAPEHVGRSHPPGTKKNNNIGGGPRGGSKALYEVGTNSSQKHSRPFAAYPGRNHVSHKDFEENMKQFSVPTHLEGEGLQRGSRPFEGGLGRPDGFSDSLPGRHPLANHHPGSFPIGYGEDYPRKPNSTDFISPGGEFGHRGIDGMPILRNPGPFLQGMTGGPGGLHKDHLGSSNLPGNGQHDFDKSEFPHTRLHPSDTFVPRNLHGGGWGGGQLHGTEDYGYRGHMHADDPNLPIDYPRHGFPQESAHFGSGGHLRNGDVSWCRICNISCGTVENLNIHVETREHQQHAMDIVLKMKQDVAKRRKMNSGGPKSFKKKVAGKGSFRGNRR